MTAGPWLASFDECFGAADFRIEAAAALARYVARYAGQAATFVEGRRRDAQELVVLDVATGAPQRPFYPIHRTERVGVFFAGEHAPPFAAMLRDDFPDTEHQLLVPAGVPAIICLDDRPWAEARLTWTPAELIERILTWFRRAGRGELHDARQPLDPVFTGSPLSFLIARSDLVADPAPNLVAIHDPTDGTVLRVREAAPGRPSAHAEPFSIVTYRVAPADMKRLRHAPDDLAELAAMLDARGIALFEDLSTRLRGWIAEGAPAAWRLNGRFAIIIELPVISPHGAQQGTDHRAFVTANRAGDIAVALGIAQPAEGHGSVGFVAAIGGGAPDTAALAATAVQCAEVHLEFDPELAARLAGHEAPDSRAAVLVGAGAIGSHLAAALAREGRFCWTVIDDDKLLPHNLARHIATGDVVTRPKAAVMAAHINGICSGAPRADAINANLFAGEADGAAIEGALEKADVIIDATASLIAARHLSDHPAAARRASVFFNPPGNAAVLLAEPAGRDLTLRDLEAQYLRLILRQEALHAHLGTEAETIAYTGACRAITNRIPETRAAILSGLPATGLAAAVDTDEGAIAVWSLTPEGGVRVDRATAEPVTLFQAGAWHIALDEGLVRHLHALRAARLPAETGGVLYGLVDIPAKRIHLVDASAAPPDSTEEAGGFVRGVSGVSELLEDVRRRTAGQVRYVGEWHSHPPRSSARPSAVDGLQLDWLAALMEMDSMPALMVIAADAQTAVIFADRRAEPLSRPRAA